MSKSSNSSDNSSPPPRSFSSSSSTTTSTSSRVLDQLESPLTLSGAPRRLNSQISNMTDDSALHNNTNNNNEQTASLREASRFDGDDEVSVSSQRSTQSTLSHRLKLASQRGEERARHHHAASSSSSSVTGDKRRKKKSSKNKAVDMSAVVRNKARQFETTSDDSSAKSPSKPSVVDISLMEHEQDKKEKKKKKSKSSDDNRSKSSKSSRSSSSKGSKKSKDRSGSNWESGSLGSQLNPNKYTDAGYLSKTADGKFQKGLYLLRKSKYQMAREFIYSVYIYFCFILIVLIDL